MATAGAPLPTLSPETHSGFGRETAADTVLLPIDRLALSLFSLEVYGDPAKDCTDLLDSIRSQGILVPLVVAWENGAAWEVISGHRRLACARLLGWSHVPCQVRRLPRGEARQQAVLEYNRQRIKTFSQRMRESDALESIWSAEARQRRQSNLRQWHVHSVLTEGGAEGRKSDARFGRTDEAVAKALGFGGKDLYRQARAIWNAAQEGDVRAQANLPLLDAGTKTVHAAYKDLRRRDRFGADFRPTPYDVWSFRHDPAFGVQHPGAIPASIIAHAIYYFSPPGGLVVDPMAGGGATLDICLSMGRRCLAYDLHPVRPDIQKHDLRTGLPDETHGCDLIFCDPPYHTMQRGRYRAEGIEELPLQEWIAFLQAFSRIAFLQLRPGGRVALLLANQTEKDVPAGYGYIDHAFLGFKALLDAGFLPERRISCPMSGGYLPQHVRHARSDRRLLGQVRDLLVMKKPLSPSQTS